MTCNHSVIKLCPSLWLACDWVGVMRGYDENGDLSPADDLACRNCNVCHSTICIPLADDRRYQERDAMKVVMEMEAL